MQTISLETQTSASTSRGKQNGTHPGLPGSMLPTGAPGKAKQMPQAPVQQAYVPDASPYADLDSMLSQDPNTGAVRGVRVALLFNAGLALSGLLAWEIWTLIAG